MHVRHSIAFFRVWLCVLALGGFQVARAQGTATVDQYCFNNNGGTCAGTWQGSPAAACSEGAAYYSGLNAPQVCAVTACSGRLDNPANQFKCTLTGGYVYSNGLSYRSTSGTLPCPGEGTKKIVNVTAGYTTSANGSDDVLALPSLVSQIGQSMCVSSGGSSCYFTIGNPVASWSSTTPTTTGLYRISDDWEMTSVGQNCAPSADEAKQTNAASAVPSCPGSFGTVNGKPVCVPSAAGVEKPAASTTNRAGNPAAGSSGTDPLASRSPSTGTNNSNNGSTPAATDGAPLGARGTGVPAETGTAAGSSGASVDLGDIQTDCDKHPTSVGCSEYGTPDNGVSLAQTDSGFSSIGAVAFASGSGCPAPLGFSVAGQQYAISYQPICDNAYTYIRPVVLVLGAALAAFIFVGGFRS